MFADAQTMSRMDGLVASNADASFIELTVVEKNGERQEYIRIESAPAPAQVAAKIEESIESGNRNNDNGGGGMIAAFGDLAESAMAAFGPETLSAILPEAYAISLLPQAQYEPDLSKASFGEMADVLATLEEADVVLIPDQTKADFIDELLADTDITISNIITPEGLSISENIKSKATNIETLSAADDKFGAAIEQEDLQKPDLQKLSTLEQIREEYLAETAEKDLDTSLEQEVTATPLNTSLSDVVKTTQIVSDATRFVSGSKKQKKKKQEESGSQRTDTLKQQQTITVDPQLLAKRTQGLRQQAQAQKDAKNAAQAKKGPAVNVASIDKFFDKLRAQKEAQKSSNALVA